MNIAEGMTTWNLAFFDSSYLGLACIALLLRKPNVMWCAARLQECSADLASTFVDAAYQPGNKSKWRLADLLAQTW